jgi:hypothetical protein
MSWPLPPHWLAERDKARAIVAAVRQPWYRTLLANLRAWRARR